MRSKLPFTVDPADKSHRSVVTVRIDITNSVRRCDFLLSTDRHHDNPHCDQKLERKHLIEARDRGAGIIDNGDLFCAMQGKYDKRSCKDALRPEHQKGNYLDRLVETGADDFAEFAPNWLVMGEGNHETAILKNHETNLTARLVERLNTMKGTNVRHCGYGSWVRFMFTRGSFRTSRLLYRFHGTGGGGPVTRGVIQTNRMAVFNPDPDVILSGHTHDGWIVPIQRQRLSDCGVPYHDTQIHVRAPGYKDEWGDSYGGWSVEKMLGPKPKGSAWLTFTYEGHDQIKTSVTQAE